MNLCMFICMYARNAKIQYYLEYYLLNKIVYFTYFCINPCTIVQMIIGKKYMLQPYKSTFIGVKL